jgi:hypothetical protein
MGLDAKVMESREQTLEDAGVEDGDDVEVL